MIKWLSAFLPSYTYVLTYMLQASEYTVSDFWKWWLRVDDFRMSTVLYRKRCDGTAKAKLLWIYMTSIAAWFLMIIAGCVLLGLTVGAWYWWVIAVAVLMLYPLLIVAIVVPVVWLGYVIIQKPKERAIITAAKKKLATTTAKRIAVAGSYGKTSMKEMLRTVLSEKYDVAATPGNKNTPLGTSGFIQTLSGNEDFIIFEYGEARVGDVAELCEITEPQYGFITGISEAHLETFGSRENIVSTIFELDDYLASKDIYRNVDSEMVQQRAGDTGVNYTCAQAGDWSAHDIEVTLEGTSFVVKHGEWSHRVTSGLIGAHQVGPLLAVMSFAHTMGMIYDQIVQGVAKTKAFEHRMQPYHLAGALVIDDTYNGNPQGMKSGLALLKQAKAKRRIYVTPGLVEMGDASDELHYTLGKQIADSADVVVLMANSAAEAIARGMKDGGFDGELDICEDPLAFYQNLDQFVAKGDVVLMQNDWSDNYA